MNRLKNVFMHSELTVMLINAIIVYLLTNWMGITIISYVYILGIVSAKLANMLIPYLPDTWVVHYCNKGEEHSILQHGFNRPTQENKVKEEYRDLHGQKGLDRVSAGFIYTKPWQRMCAQRTASGELVPIYIKTKVNNAELTQARITRMFTVETYGCSIETTTDRIVINQAIKSGSVCLEKPNPFYSWSHVILIIGGMHTGLTIDKLLRAQKMNSATIKL